MKDCIAGATLGALVGSLLGLSSQSVVAGTIAAAFTLVASFIGVAKPAAFAPTQTDQGQNSRIIAFGLAATLFFFLCYIASIRHAFDPSPNSILDELKAAGFSEDRAKLLIGSKYFGAVPSDWKKTIP